MIGFATIREWLAMEETKFVLKLVVMVNDRVLLALQDYSSDKTRGMWTAASRHLNIFYSCLKPYETDIMLAKIDKEIIMEARILNSTYTLCCMTSIRQHYQICF